MSEFYYLSEPMFWLGIWIFAAVIWITYEEFRFRWWSGHIADYLIERAKKTPYLHIGNYMERYWLVPYRKSSYERNDGTGWVRFYKRPIAFLLQCFGIAVRVHRIRRSDKGRDHHNHPWPWVAIILRGGYYEDIPVYDKDGYFSHVETRRRSAGSIRLCRSTQFHRIDVEPGTEAWTLFITGWKMRHWGFLIAPKYLMPHEKYHELMKLTGDNHELVNHEHHQEVFGRTGAPDTDPEAEGAGTVLWLRDAQLAADRRSNRDKA